MRRFRIDALPVLGQTGLLNADVSHHVLRVTLIPRGSELVIFDGQGSECRARLVGVVDGMAQVEALEEPRRVRVAPRVVLVMGLPRKPAWERILRMGTELGVTEFLPFVAKRSVARGEHLDRWRRLVDSASGQCGRSDVPIVHPLSESIELPPERLVLAPGAARGPRPMGDVALLIGPEGGLTKEEREGWTPVGLGPNVLRSDTAAVAALTLYAPPTP